MLGHGGSSAGSYLANPTSPIPSHCASIVVTSTVRVKLQSFNYRRLPDLFVCMLINLLQSLLTITVAGGNLPVTELNMKSCSYARS